MHKDRDFKFVLKFILIILGFVLLIRWLTWAPDGETNYKLYDESAIRNPSEIDNSVIYVMPQ